MPKNYGVKEKDVVISYVVDQIFAGTLRSGDRLDRGEVAATLGISRVPVQEALVQLERDGIVSMRYHRGAFLEAFDASVVAEHHEVFGVLSAIASSRAATHPTPRILRELGDLLVQMRAEPEPAEFEDLLLEFRRAINHEYAGARLRAALSSFGGFLPKTFWMSYPDNQAQMLPFYEAEYAAIRRGDPDGARAACLGRTAAMAEVLTAELVRRGVFAAEGLPALANLDSSR